MLAKVKKKEFEWNGAPAIWELSKRTKLRRELAGLFVYPAYRLASTTFVRAALDNSSCFNCYSSYFKVPFSTSTNLSLLSNHAEIDLSGSTLESIAYPIIGVQWTWYDFTVAIWPIWLNLLLHKNILWCNI